MPWTACCQHRDGVHERDPAVGVAGGVEPQLQHALVDDGGEVGVRHDRRETRRACGQAHAALAGLLGLAQRLVGLAEGELAAGGAELGDTDARADGEGPVAGAVRHAEHVDDALGDLLGLGQRAGDQDGELVAAEAGDQVVVADDGVEPAGDLDQQLVAGLVPGDVVDGLEAVEVEHQQAALARSRARPSPGTASARLGSAVRWSV